jgi:outer membrane protein assembly factor BamA
MTVGWSFDSRNDVYRASRGGMLNANLAYSGGIIGGRTNQWNPTLEATYYYSPFRKQTFAFHLTAAYVAAFAGEQIQSYQRLFTGGEFTLRAFPLNGVAPYTNEGREFIDPKTNVIEGGNRSYVANFEYVYHVADPMDIALFYDMGQVYHEKQTTDIFRSLRDVGFELRFYIPAIQAPLRMFWAHNLTPRPCTTPRMCDQGTVFQFTIGQTF